MKTSNRNLIIRHAVLISALAAFLGACASAPEVEDRFLRTTGATWRVAGKPMVFEHTEARYSRSGRDYAYVGPVALNRRGTYDYFLWVGIGSTLDRGFLAPEETVPDSVLIFVDGEPLELPLSHWDQRIPGLAGAIPYDPPVAVEWHLAARVTLDQIEMISQHGIDHLLLQSDEGRSRAFFEWGEQFGWETFVAQSP